MNEFRVVFRADASLSIGSGHVMRCLTLADALSKRGAECTFICREHPGNLIEYIRSKGYRVYTLARGYEIEDHNEPGYASWLGVPQEEDAQVSAALVKELRPRWVVVDHYALDKAWHRIVRPHAEALMAVDDLCDREHQVDLLLDQNLGRTEAQYRSLVPSGCKVLAGTTYALLRPEFAEWRRRRSASAGPPSAAQRVLITMGGVDTSNATGAALDALSELHSAPDLRITVVLGQTAPWLESVQAQAARLPWRVEVRTGVRNMAELMAEHELAVGAAGSTSWERCCLGLPTVMVVLAENQSYIAESLAAAGAAVIARLDSANEDRHSIRSQVQALLKHPDTLERIRRRAANLVDGEGAERVVNQMMSSPL